MSCPERFCGGHLRREWRVVQYSGTKAVGGIGRLLDGLADEGSIRACFNRRGTDAVGA